MVSTQACWPAAIAFDFMTGEGAWTGGLMAGGSLLNYRD